MGSNSATIWSSISTGFANLWSNQDLPRGKSTSDCQFHFLPPSLFENTYPMFASILQCSKREFILLKICDYMNYILDTFCCHCIFHNELHVLILVYIGCYRLSNKGTIPSEKRKFTYTCSSFMLFNLKWACYIHVICLKASMLRFTWECSTNFQLPWYQTINLNRMDWTEL